MTQSRHAGRRERSPLRRRVFSSDGVRIGSVNRVVVDQESLDVHSVVVRETRRFSGHSIAGAGLLSDEVAVPLDRVRSARRDRIDLTLASSEVRRAEPYLTYQYAPLKRGDVFRMVVADIGQSGYVPRLIETAHKRLDELEIRPGENVMLGSSGKRLGTVRDLVLDEGELVGIQVHPDGHFKEDVLLQVRFLGRSDDMALFAHLSDTDLATLTPFHPTE